MTDETPDRPDPEAIYECLSGFISPGPSPDRPVVTPTGRRLNGSDPLVIKYPERFRLAPDDVLRRQQAEIRDLLRSRVAPDDRGGPPPSLGLTIEAIRTALREWPAAWPPTQAGLTDYSARRVRQVLEDAETDWRTEVATAEAERKR